MEIYFQLITDAEGVEKACAELAAERVLGFDTETTELDPYKGDLRLVQFSGGKGAVIFDMKPFRDRNGGSVKEDPALEPLRKLIADPSITKVAHNAKFDAKWVRHHLGCELGGAFDTYLASVLIAAGDSERRHSLADAAQVFLGTELDKSQQVSDWGAEELSRSQIEYAARDAAILLPLREAMLEKLTAGDLERVAKLEFECIAPIAEMELNGFYLDNDRWHEQIAEAKVVQQATANELQDMLSAGVAQASLFGRAEINLDSQAQVSDALTNLGIPVPDTTRATALQPLAEQYPVIAKLLEYRTAQKSLTSFGENILGFIEPATGRIHADFRQIGAPTGRFSCSNPNLQQIPHETKYRRCFVAPKGKKLVVADYSQIELRILADFSNDKNFIDAFVSGQDLHAATAAQVFGVAAEDVTADQRSFAKRLNFGVVYGIGASRFAAMTGLSQKEAEVALQKYFATYPGLNDWLRQQASNIVTERTARTASGRTMRFKFDETDRQQVSAAQRNAKNMPVQGTSADILKRALFLLHESIRGTSAKLVNIVHDEIIVECDEVESTETAKLLESAMVAAGQEFISKVPIKIDVSVSDEWAK